MAEQTKTEAQLEAETQDEIEKIMGEIDHLQKSMADAPATVQAVALPTGEPESMDTPESSGNEAGETEMTMEDFRGGSDEPSMEDTLGNLMEEPAAGGLLAETIAAPVVMQEEATVTELKPKLHGNQGGTQSSDGAAASQDGTLTLSLAGSMTLKLRYECDGQEITIGFVDDALKVELSDGTEFKVPVKRRSARQKIA